jgi:alkanesulfonate monooxygenase SsuD/methylene tetrahydromethanopterin reductase-like flavin-dependent oxidoreductase (luciferase family)
VIASQRLSEERLRDLAELAEKATPGPWELVESEPYVPDRAAPDAKDYFVGFQQSADGPWFDADSTVLSPENAAYIAAVDPSTIASLIDMAEKRLAIIGALFKVLNKHPELTAEVVSSLAALSPDAMAE